MEETLYQQCFSRLERARAGAFVPFAVLGDPDPDTSLDLLRTFAAAGADMLELGIAFSDPVADGPAIQAADRRAMAAGATPGVAMEIMAAFRREHADIPIGLLLYANLVHRPGPAKFYRQLAAAGADSVLVADLPIDEAQGFSAAAAAAGVGQVFMITPGMPESRFQRTLAARGPYLYVVSRTGVTGQDRDLAATAGPLLRRIAGAQGGPSLLGFGISRPAQVAAAIAAGADGAISGSAIAELIGRHCRVGGAIGRPARARLLTETRRFVRAMKRATVRR